MTNRNELERLLAAATEGPWGIWREPIQNRDDAISELTEQVQATDNLSDALVLLDAGGKCPCTTGCGTESEANAALICFLRNNAQHYLSLMDEVERLREALSKADEPHWFYAEGWEERCLHSPDEAIDLLDFAPGQYVTEVATARPCKSIWCAVRVTDDEDADERYSFTEHSTEEEARQALGETHDN